MAANKKTKLLARQLLALSLADGLVSPERVGGVLAYLEKNPPRNYASVLRQYQLLIARELAKSRAIVEHAGPLSDSALRSLEAALSEKFQRPIRVTAQPSAALLAGVRVRLGDNVYESSVAGQLAALAAAV
ncbi:MAG: F0F1 ATP synthase subunit delta [Opitutaceae bacterium]|nr:F0F1 ATP synthase subunit delta [Opitutaceae bacterium]